MHRVGKTKEATGVVIFISLFEHMVYVLGDVEISKHFTDEDFVEVNDAIINGFRKNQCTNGLVEGIRLCGHKLKEHCPSQRGDENELCNELKIWKQYP